MDHASGVHTSVTTNMEYDNNCHATMGELQGMLGSKIGTILINHTILLVESKLLKKFTLGSESKD